MLGAEVVGGGGQMIDDMAATGQRGGRADVASTAVVALGPTMIADVGDHGGGQGGGEMESTSHGELDDTCATVSFSGDHQC